MTSTALGTTVISTHFIECEPDNYGPNWVAATKQLPAKRRDQIWSCEAAGGGYIFQLVELTEE